jgi:two-component system NarL family sensor kinase
MVEKSSEVVIIITTVIVLLMAFGIILLFSIFQRRKNDLLKDQEKEREKFEKEIAETQIEIREETLRNISWELHDNIGQLLTLAKIQLQNATKENIKEVSDTITRGLTEVRSLSKLINPEAINNIHLHEAVQLEVDRFNRLNFIDSSLNVLGDVKEIDKKHNIIIFRILQEFFSNTIKHSRASILKISLNYKENSLKIIAQDNGVGFTSDSQKEGIGLINIKKRAQLIGAEINFLSEKEKGTMLEIYYKL